MKRVGFLLKVRGDKLEEYKQHHKAVWPEMLDALRQSLPDDPLPLLAKIRLLKSDKMWSQINQSVTSWCQSHPNDVNVPLIVANDLAGGQGDEPKKIAEELLSLIIILSRVFAIMCLCEKNFWFLASHVIYC